MTTSNGLEKTFEVTQSEGSRKIWKSKNDVLTDADHELKMGIIDSFLLSLDIHDGSYIETETEADPHCLTSRKEVENLISILKTCSESASNNKLFKIMSEESTEITLLYTGKGRSLEQKHLIAFNSDPSELPGNSLRVITSSKLQPTSILSTDDTELKHFKDRELDHMSVDESMTDKSLKEIHKCLELLEKKGQMSHIGSEELTKLTFLLSRVDQSTHEKLLAQYENKNIFKYFIEASALVDNGDFLQNVIRFITVHQQGDLGKF